MGMNPFSGHYPAIVWRQLLVSEVKPHLSAPALKWKITQQCTSCVANVASQQHAVGAWRQQSLPCDGVSWYCWNHFSQALLGKNTLNTLNQQQNSSHQTDSNRLICWQWRGEDTFVQIMHQNMHGLKDIPIQVQGANCISDGALGSWVMHQCTLPQSIPLRGCWAISLCLQLLWFGCWITALFPYTSIHIHPASIASGRDTPLALTAKGKRLTQGQTMAASYDIGKLAPCTVHRAPYAV